MRLARLAGVVPLRILTASLSGDEDGASGAGATVATPLDRPATDDGHADQAAAARMRRDDAA